MWNSEMNHQFRVGCVYCDTSAIPPTRTFHFLEQQMGKANQKFTKFYCEILATVKMPAKQQRGGWP